MGHVASMIMEGVFEQYPTLQVLCVGGGVTWLPAYAWRLDYWYKTNAQEAPWLKRLPSEYLHDHVRLGTHSLESPHEPEKLTAALKTWPGIENMLVYTSGYPTRESELPNTIAARLPSEWHDPVFRGNATQLFRLPLPASGNDRNAEPTREREN